MKFRRKTRPTEPAAEEASAAAPEIGEEATETPGRPASGPFDVEDVAGDGVDRIDLGSLLIEPEPGRDLRIQLDQGTDQVQTVFLAGADGALEIRAFAAPRNGDLWSTVRPQLAADMARKGGTATEREGRWGPELMCRLTVQAEDGRTAQQPTRIIGVNGSRWMLRATLIGRPAMDPDDSAAWEETISKLVVRRGEHAMPVGDPLPVHMPANAQIRSTPDA